MSRSILIAIVGSITLALPADVRAGAVEFNPANPVVDPSIDPTTDIDVSLASLDSVSKFVGLDAIFGSDDLAVTGFAIDAGLCTAGDLVCSVESPAQLAVWSSDLQLNVLVGDSRSAPILLGILTVDATGLAPGDYTVGVSSDLDQYSQVINATALSEAIDGMTTITVIPEPATVVLLAMGLIVVLRRKYT